MKSNSYLLPEFKKAMFRATVFWIVVSIIGIRLYSTFLLGEALPVVGHLAENTISCEVKEDTSGPDSNPRYITPNKTVIDTYHRSTLGENLVKNSNFTTVDETGILQNYELNEPNPEHTKTLLSDEDNQKFLRVDQKVASRDDSGSWAPDFSDIGSKPYFYSFSYRSSVAANITVEFQDAAGKSTNVGLYELDPAKDWTTIQGHFDNYSGKYTKARILVSAKGVGSLDIRHPQLLALGYESLGVPLISVAFDDGWESVYTNARPLLSKYSIPTTQFILPEFAKNNESGYMNFSQLQTLQTEGHEIASHSLKHCDQTSLSPQDLQKDTMLSNEILTKHGFPQKGGFAYPYGKYSAETQTDKKANFQYIRSSDEGLNDYYLDISNIKVKSVEKDTTTADVESWIKSAKDQKLWLVLLYHRINEDGGYSSTSNEFENHLKLIKNSEVKTVTIKDALKFIGR